MHRRAVVVGSPAEFDVARLDVARSGDGHGTRVLLIEEMAGRLAGGFLGGVRAESLAEAISAAIDALDRDALGNLADLRGLPGLRRSVTASLRRAWRTGIDLAASEARSPRISALAAIEADVLRRLPVGQLRPADLAARARERLAHAPTVLGPVEFRRLPDLDPCWRGLVLALSETVPVAWNAGGFQVPGWVAASDRIELVAASNVAPEKATFSCAGPRHEIIEALRWARELLATGQARPEDIAIAAASTEPYDDMVAALSEEASLPVRFAHGRPALLSPDGQAAAALADVLLRGLTQERVRRLLGRISQKGTPLAGLPPRWWSVLNGDATLSTPERWRLALASEEAKPVADVLLPLIDLLARGPEVAVEAGEQLLRGPARAIWRRALVKADAAALDRELEALRVPDPNEAGASILWAPASVLAACPRPYVWLTGLNARSWPRPATEDALLPDHILGDLKPEETSISRRDRESFAAIQKTAAKTVVRSLSRREPGGRRLGVSPLIQAGDAVRLLRGRTPRHAMSEPDRLLARPDEFAATPEARAADSCWRAWRSEDLTAHDGLIGRLDHPAILRALGRVQSASSLTKLLRNPLGFTFTYALGMKAPEIDEEPLTLDNRAFGDLVHDLLEAAADHLGRAGVVALDRAAVTAAIAAVRPAIAARWAAERPLPPALVWAENQERAVALAVAALSFPFQALPGQQTYVEVPFGVDPAKQGRGPRGSGDEPPRPAPWDVEAQVPIPETDLHIGGFIDRLDLAGDGTRARVIDYKTGKRHGGAQLRGGRDLQRCLYAYAVGALLPSARDAIEAGLLHPMGGGAFEVLSNPADTLGQLSAALNQAVSNLRRGLSLPGVAAGLDGEGGDYDDLRFALPVVPGTTLELKKRLAAARFGQGITDFWKAD